MTGNHVAPTTTVTLARVRLFQSTQRPKPTTGEWIKTSWGRCRVVGRLGQRHADLLESLLYVAERRRESDDGGIELLVDPARVRTALSDRRHSLACIKKWLREMCEADIVIDSFHIDEHLIGRLLDHVELSPMTRHNPLTGGTRHMWRVRLGKLMVELIRRDVQLWYNPIPIARLQYGISQAIARHILTHTQQPVGGWHLIELLKTVGGQGRLRDRLRETCADVEKLRDIGIIIDEGRVWREHRPDKREYRPVSASTGPRVRVAARR